MERVIILKNTVTEQALTMPVTPSSYPMEAGRAVERLDMAQTGVITVPGLKSRMAEVLNVMLPAHKYPFCTPDAVVNPWYYIGLLTEWSDAHQVCRYIVTGTEINIPVLLGPVYYEEKDGTNDVYARIPLYEFSYLDEVKVQDTQNSGRASESGNQALSSGTYVVQAGDSLWSISKKIYGDGSMATKLAAANGISNPNLIYVRQVLTLPGISSLDVLGTGEPASAPVSYSVPLARAATRVALGLR